MKLTATMQLVLLAAASLSVDPVAGAAPPANTRAAVADVARPTRERQRDADRKPRYPQGRAKHHNQVGEQRVRP
jgi:hypothetical protein